MSSIIELLSPAGNILSAKQAINGGCDALYLGGKDFSARSFSDNFSNEEIEEILDYAHIRGVKVYITVNTLYKDEELKKLVEFLSFCYKVGADGFIVQDIGTADFIFKNYNISVYASTQMSIHGENGAKFLKNLGFKRVVLSRELSLSEIKKVTSVDIETEVFIHGALCVSYSGQCLMSSILGTRSGNRGKCAQSCRQIYSLFENKKEIIQGYLLSPRDVSGIENIDSLKEANVTSLKIEGRMKSPEYTGLVTKVYRTYIDNGSITEKNEKDLLQIFNRGGAFSKGYLNTYSSKDMMSIESPKSTGIYLGEVVNYNKKTLRCDFFTDAPLVPGDGIEIWSEPHTGIGINKAYEANERVSVEIEGNIEKGNKVFRSFDKKLSDELKRAGTEDNKKITISGEISAKFDEPLKIILKKDNLIIEETGPMVLKAENKPITEEKLIEQLSKTGNTSIKIDFTNINVDKDIFIPIGEINKLRRGALEKFINEFTKSFKRENKNVYINESKESSNDTNKKLSVLVRKKYVFDIVSKYNPDTIYLDSECLLEEEIDYYTNNFKNIFLSLPTIARDKLELYEEKDFTGYLVKNYEELNMLSGTKKKIAINYNFNVFNNLSYSFFNSKYDRICLSPELNLKEINTFPNDSEIVIYGKLPLMTTVQCPIGLYAANKGTERFCKLRYTKNEYYLKDKKNLDFPVKSNCTQCYSEIFNANTIFMLDKTDDILNSKAEYLRLEFLDENPETVKSMMDFHTRMLKEETFSPEKIKEKMEGITHGHFYRGVL